MESLTATPEPELTDEAETMPEVEPDGLYEVVNGRVVEKPLMGAFQVHVASILFRILGQFAWAQ